MRRVSVIIPIFNNEQYISECLDSIIEQTYPVHEIICVNDGSTDGTDKILKYYTSKYKKIKVINKEKTNAGDARNIGLDFANGEYVFFIDSDDWIDSNLIKRCMQMIEVTGAEVICFNAYSYHQINKDVSKIDWLINDSLIPRNGCYQPGEISEDLFQAFSSNIWNKIILRSVLVNYDLRFSSMSSANDEYVGAMVLVCSKKIGVIKDNLYYYRINTGISTQDKHRYNYDDNFLRALRQICNSIRSLDKEDVFGKTLMKKAIAECYNKINDIAYDSLLSDKLFEICKYELIADEEFLKIQKEDASFFCINERLFVKSLFDDDVKKILLLSMRQNLEINLKDWSIPNRALIGKKVVLFGAGNVGKNVYNRLVFNHSIKTIKWVDSDHEKKRKEGLDVDSVSSLSGTEFDIVFIAVLNRDSIARIRKVLYDSGFKDKQIIDLYSIYINSNLGEM